MRGTRRALLPKRKHASKWRVLALSDQSKAHPVSGRREECSSLSALGLRDGPWGSQVGLTSLPKAAPSLAGNVFRCIFKQACELRGGRVKTRERARPRKETCRPRHTCRADGNTCSIYFFTLKEYMTISLLYRYDTFMTISYARIKVAWINIYKCELWYYVLLSPLNILPSYEGTYYLRLSRLISYMGDFVVY